jgi:biotin carboxylase
MFEGIAVWKMVTDRLPLAPPLRETGAVLPSSRTEADRDLLMSRAIEAVQALGIAHGFLHVEMKDTKHGPEVIEVNGRLGGPIGTLIRILTGVNLVSAALESAAGTKPNVVATIKDCALMLVIVPPTGRSVLDRLPQRAELLQIPGVVRVDFRVTVGEEMNSVAGESGKIGAVWIRCSDHLELERSLNSVHDFLSKTLAYS